MVSVKRFEQSCFLVELGGKRIYFDPYKITKNAPMADIVCISHSHFDHYDKKSIKIIKEVNTKMFCPASRKKIVSTWGASGLKEGEEDQIDNISIKAVPMYNQRWYRKVFHSRKKGFIGYIVSDGDITVYHAGDTDFIPEMKDLPPIDIAFLPIGGTFTMNMKEAVDAVNALAPKIAVPMHEKGKDPQEFRELAKEKNDNLNIEIIPPFQETNIDIVK